jgi:hypothetical protein
MAAFLANVRGFLPLETYLPPATPAFAAEGGVFCMCGYGVRYGEMHEHGGGGFRPISEKAWPAMRLALRTVAGPRAACVVVRGLLVPGVGDTTVAAVHP